MIERPSSVTILVLCVLACAAGAAAVLMAGAGFSVAQDLSTEDRILDRPSGNPLMITEAHWQPEPRLFGDFDVQLDVDLSPGAELDLMVRRVEPRPVNGERLPFQGRFTVLRISAAKEPSGPGWRTREQALFERGGGVDIAAGTPATIWVEGRGRTLTGNVAGMKLSPFEAADDYGSFVLLARSGKVAVHRFVITSRGPVGVPPWLLGAGIGLLLCGLGWLCGVRSASLLVSLPLLPAGALLGRALVLGDLLPLAVPATASVLLAAFCCGPLLLVDWLPRAGARRLLAWLRVAMALLLALGLLEAGRRNEDVRRRGSEHPALELVFGKGAGEGVAEALAGRVRGPYAIHVPDAEKPAVLLLGGKLMWSPEEPARGADALLESELVVKRGQKVEVMATPTEDGYSQQQWLQYDLFYRRLHPAVLVFGVPAQEDAEEPGGSAMERLQRCAEWHDHRLRLLPFTPPRGLLHRSALPRGHRTNRLELRAILQRVRADCDASGVRLVLAAGATLPVAFREELRAVADGTPLFELSSGEPEEAMVERLAGVIAPLLAK